MQKTKILFTGNLKSSFVKNDYEILKKYFYVYNINSPTTKFEWIKYILMLIKNIKKYDLIFSWFASCDTSIAIFFSKLFKKKSIVIVGGFDAIFAPEINYGAFTNKKEKIASKYIYKHANKILVVSYHLKKEIIKNADVKGDNIDYLHTGHDSNYWKPKGKKENIILTVAIVNDLDRIKLKGIDTFVKSAKYFQKTKFIVIGVKSKAKDYLKKISTENVELIEFLPAHKLLQYYQSAKIYCQLSYSEGLPTALCESMLCECIPIGSKNDGIKNVIGNTGFYANYGDEKSTVDMIKKALFSKDNLDKKARERIKKNFSVQQRKDGLKKFIIGIVE